MIADHVVEVSRGGSWSWVIPSTRSDNPMGPGFWSGSRNQIIVAFSGDPVGDRILRYPHLYSQRQFIWATNRPYTGLRLDPNDGALASDEYWFSWNRRRSPGSPPWELGSEIQGFSLYSWDPSFRGIIQEIEGGPGSGRILVNVS